MSTVIYCRSTAHNEHSFFLSTDRCCYFLFSQEYHQAVEDRFRNGMTLKEALNYKPACGRFDLEKTISKFPTYIKYVEKEYNIAILEQTKRKLRAKRNQEQARAAREKARGSRFLRRGRTPIYAA